MKDVSDVHFRVCDHGLFLPIAQRLARQARKVSYWTPTEKAFPTVRDNVGDGFPNVEWVNCYLRDFDDVDCFVFPDIGFAGIQNDIETMKPVWGSKHGSELEISRGKFLDKLAEIGLPVPKYEKVVGISNLRKALEGVEDRWIKISKYRGDWETFHWRGQKEDDQALDYYAVRFGPFREHITFYVFEPIDSNIEDGCDSWCIDGQFPRTIVHGMECKDRSFIGTFQQFADLPEPLRRVGEVFGPELGRYGYRSFFSTEVRITEDGEGYFIDPTCRAGSPPSQCMAEMIENYAEIIWHGANGILMEPQSAAKFGVQAVCNFKRDEECWTYVKLPEELWQWVKSANCMWSDGMLCIPPGHAHTHCEDWIVGVGDRMDEAIRHLQHNVKQLPDGVTCDVTSLAELITEINEAEDKGMEFSDQKIPPPEIALTP